MKKEHYLAGLMMCVFLVSMLIGQRSVSASHRGIDEEAINLQMTPRAFLPLFVKSDSPINLNIKNGDFEAGNDGSWQVYSYQGFENEIITTSGYPQPHGGQYLAWLGGFQNEQASISQSVMISSGSPYLHFWYWVDSSDAILHDYFRLYINGNEFFKLMLCTASNTYGWKEKVLDLNYYKGQTVEIKFEVTTDEPNPQDEYGSNLYLDDISLQSVQ